MKNNLNFITKSFLVKTFAVLIIIGMMDSSVFSQTRIRFAKGKLSKTITGDVNALVPIDYLIDGKRGQTLTIRVSSPKGTVRLSIGDNVSTTYTVKLDSSEDYKFSVYNAYDKNYSKYTLYVSIK